MTMFDTSSLGVPDAGLFDREAERSHTLPAEWYYDDAVFKAEREAIFFKSWIYQCHESDLPEPGDYTAGAVTDQGVILIRGEDGAIRGFYNVCSHRAHPLLAGQGRTKLIVCPYHQWTYATDGTFRGARGRETLSDWCPENADLKPVRVETIGGLIFVNLDQAAIPLAEQIGRFEADMRECCPRLDELVKVERYERQVAANWKTVIDNNHECYHCAVNHKSLMELVDYRDKAVWSDDGITFSHRVEKKTLDNGAYRVDGSNLEQESLFGYIWPTLIPLFFPGSASLALFQVVPLTPETTLERWDFCFTSREPDPQERAFMDYITGTLIPEDVALCEAVQTGLHSRGYRQGRFVVDRERPEFSEHHVHFFQAMVHDALTGIER